MCEDDRTDYNPSVKEKMYVCETAIIALTHIYIHLWFPYILATMLRTVSSTSLTSQRIPYYVQYIQCNNKTDNIIFLIIFFMSFLMQQIKEYHHSNIFTSLSIL